MLTVEEIAAEAKIDPRTVRRAIERGELVASRLGQRGGLRVKPEEYERWIERRTVGPKAAVSAEGRSHERPRRGRLRVA